MKKYKLALLGFLANVAIQLAKQVPVLKPVAGFIEFLAVAILVGTILYIIGLNLYLWFKVRKKD